MSFNRMFHKGKRIPSQNEDQNPIHIKRVSGLILEILKPILAEQKDLNTSWFIGPERVRYACLFKEYGTMMVDAQLSMHAELNRYSDTLKRLHESGKILQGDHEILSTILPPLSPSCTQKLSPASVDKIRLYINELFRSPAQEMDGFGIKQPSGVSMRSLG